MVPADSRKISRVPRYSGYHYASFSFEYRTITVYGPIFQRVLLTKFLATSWSYNPNIAVTTLVWAVPRSLATTCGITFVFFSYGYLDVSVPHVRLPYGMTGLLPAGLPHSEIFGSKVICTYPKLIAAYHVLHRLREPRHPPCALFYFLYSFTHTTVLAFRW